MKLFFSAFCTISSSLTKVTVFHCFVAERSLVPPAVKQYSLVITVYAMQSSVKTVGSKSYSTGMNQTYRIQKKCPIAITDDLRLVNFNSTMNIVTGTSP